MQGRTVETRIRRIKHEGLPKLKNRSTGKGRLTMGYVIIGALAAGIGVLAVVLCVRIKEYVKVKKKNSRKS